MGIIEITVICIVLIFWIWGVVEVLKGDLSGSALTKWLIIIIIMPLVGFILYLRLGRKRRGAD